MNEKRSKGARRDGSNPETRAGRDANGDEAVPLEMRDDINRLLGLMDGVSRGDFLSRAPERLSFESTSSLGSAFNGMVDCLQRTRRFELQQVFDSTASAMRLVDQNFRVIHMNSAMHSLIDMSPEEAAGGLCYEQMECERCHTSGCFLETIKRGETPHSGLVTMVSRNGQRIPCLSQATPHRRQGNELLGIIEDFRDVSEQMETMEQLRTANEQLAQTQDLVLSLSTPVLQLWDRVLALPLIGTLDSSRAQQAMEEVLEKIVAERAKFIILDVTGVPIVDTLVANYLVQTMAAVKLIGAEGILTGISPSVAQTMVKLGVDVSGLLMRRSLAEGLKLALERIGGGGPGKP